MLTPIDIHNREFKKGLRGYKESEVDEFLDRVVADYEKLWRENERLKEQARFNEKEINHYKNLERNLQDTLVVAQKTADEVISAAKKNAREMRENAVRETQNMREQTQIDIKRQLDDAQQKLRVIVSEYNRLITDKEAFFIRIRTTLESELAIANQLLHSLPPSEDFGKIQSSIFDAFEQDIKSQALVDAALKPPAVDEESEEESSEVPIVDAVKEVDVEDDNTKVVPEKSVNTNLRNSDKVSKIEQALKSAKAASQAKLEAELERTTAYTPVKKS